MHRFTRFLLLLVLALSPLTHARAETLNLPGQWQQIVSNAGNCEKCRITIKQKGSVFTVTANNGWSAIVETDRRGKSSSASGVGRWKPGSGAYYGGMPFDIRLATADGQLYMNMSVRMENGTRRAIKAIFERSPSVLRDRSSAI